MGDEQQKIWGLSCLLSTLKVNGEVVSPICGIILNCVSLNNFHTSCNLNHALHLLHNITGGQVTLLDHCKWLQLVLH